MKVGFFAEIVVFIVRKENINRNLFIVKVKGKGLSN